MSPGGVRQGGRAAATTGGSRVLVQGRGSPAGRRRRPPRRPNLSGDGSEGTIILLLLAVLLGCLAMAAAAGLQRSGVVLPVDRISVLLTALVTAFLAIGIGFSTVRPRSPGRTRAPGVARRPPLGTQVPVGGRAPSYESLVRVSDRLARATTMDAVLSAVAEEAARAVRTPIAIFLVDRLRERLFLAGAHGVPEAVRRVWPAVGVEGMDRLFDGRRVAVISEVSTSQVPDREIHAAVGVRSAAFVRLEHGGEGLGVIAALSLDEPRSFAADDLVVLRGIADHASRAVAGAIAIRNARVAVR